jgi:hypothetical protein
MEALLNLAIYAAPTGAQIFNSALQSTTGVVGYRYVAAAGAFRGCLRNVTKEVAKMNYRRVLQLMIGALLLASLSHGIGVPIAANGSAAPSQGSYQTIKIGKAEGAIVPRERAADFVKALSGTEEKDYWTPTKDDVRKLEAKIEFYLRKVSDRRSPALWSKLAEYRRQYAGIVENGRKKIYANFFCKTAQITDWKINPVAVEDGGDCFFQIKYDVEAGTFSSLYINGNA